MKSYLEGCGVPIAAVGSAEVPRLIMGIHPYDGCSYQNAERDGENFKRFGTVITSVHHAGVTTPLLEAENIPVDGYLTTVNQPGFMFPTRELALDAIRSASKPVIAIKPMAGGRYLGEKAFEFVFNEVGVAASMFGMGTLERVRQTTGAARSVLGAN